MENHEKNAESFDHEITLKIKKGTYYFSIPDLMLTSKETDIESAYQNLLLKKDKFFKDAEEAGLEIPPGTAKIAKSSSAPTLPQTSSNIKSYFTKVVGTAVVILVTTFFLINMVVNNIGRQLESNVNNLDEKINSTLNRGKAKVQNLMTRKPGHLLEKELYKAVDHPISPERQEKIIKSLRIIVDRLRPFVKEIAPLFSEDKNLLYEEKESLTKLK